MLVTAMLVAMQLTCTNEPLAPVGSPDELGTDSPVDSTLATSRSLYGRPVAVTAPALSGLVGAEVSDTASAVGGTPPYTFSKAHGPDSLSIAADGTISGTFTTAGSFAYTVRVVDRATPPDTATATDTVTVRAGPLSVMAPALFGAKGTAIFGVATISGGTPPYEFSKASGPDSLTVAADGTISGTFAATGSFAYTVRVVDAATPRDTATATDTVTINAPPTATIDTVVCFSLTCAARGRALDTDSHADSLKHRWITNAQHSWIFGDELVFAYDQSRTDTIAYIVTDETNLSDTASTPVVVTDAFALSQRPSSTDVRLDITLPQCSVLQENQLALDKDGDGLLDSCEFTIASSFSPYLWYDANDPSSRADAHEPYWAVARAEAGSNFPKSDGVSIPDSSLVIFYALAYYYDDGYKGRGGHVGDLFGGSHQGDSEFIVVWVSVSGRRYRLEGTFLSAHFGVLGVFDHSTMRIRTSQPVQFDRMRTIKGRPVVWVASGKHANYGRPMECFKIAVISHNPDKCYGASYQRRSLIVDSTRNLGSSFKPLVDRVYASRSYFVLNGKRHGLSGVEYFWTQKRFHGWILPTDGGGSSPYANLLRDKRFLPHAKYSQAPQGVEINVRCDDLKCYLNPGSPTDDFNDIERYYWDFAATNGSRVDSVRHFGKDPKSIEYDFKDFDVGDGGRVTIDLAVYDGFGHAGKSKKEIGMPPVSASISSDCTGLSCRFRGQGNSEHGMKSYAWSFGDGQSKTVATNTVGYTYGAAGTYTVQLEATDSARNTRTASTKVTVPQGLVVSFMPDCTHLRCIFDNMSTLNGNELGEQDARHEWTIGDSTYTEFEPSHTFPSAGRYWITLSVELNGGRGTGAIRDTLRVYEPLRVNTRNLAGAAGTTVSDTATASGGRPPYRFSKGNRGPRWLSVDSIAGIVSGTPTDSGTFGYDVRVTDSGSDTATASGTITVCEALLASAPNLSGTVGALVSGTAGASGGCAPYTFSMTSGPSWLSVSSSGSIWGTPTSSGAFGYGVMVIDSVGNTATASAAITVGCPPLSASAPNLSGTVGASVAGTAGASGGCAPYTFSMTSGPSWLSVSSGGSILGTPTSSGTYSYGVRVTDSAYSTATATGTITVGCPPLSATAPNLSGTVGAGVSGTASASGGCSPYTFSKASGPSWLSTSSAGAISGTPTSSGTFGYGVGVTDSDNNTATASGTITVGCPPLSATAPNLSGTVGASVAGTAGASGGCPPYTFEKGRGPTWLSVSSSGAISGTPSSSGTFVYDVRVTDSKGNRSTNGGSISVSAPPLRLTVPSIPATINEAFSATATASGGRSGYTFGRASGPIWLSVSSTGTIWGTPDELGDFAFTVTVTDRAGTTRTVGGTVYVSPPPLNAIAPSLSGVVGSQLSGSASASGGLPPYTFSKRSGPSWLSIASGGSISGTPDRDGTFSYVVIVTDTADASATATGSISATPPPLSGTAPSFRTVINMSVSGNARASGGKPPYSFSKGSGPRWLSVSSSGAVSGTPTSSGSFAYSVTVTDSSSATATASANVHVNPALSLNVPTMIVLPGELFIYSVNAMGGLTPYSYRLWGAPEWISISLRGSLSGRPPSSASGSYSFIVQVTDNTRRRVTASASIRVGALGPRRPGG